jgi:hypothetical protein
MENSMVQDNIVIQKFEKKCGRIFHLKQASLARNFVYHAELEYGWRVSENRVLRETLVYRESQGQEDGENCIVRSITICTFHQILFELTRKKL